MKINPLPSLGITFQKSMKELYPPLMDDIVSQSRNSDLSLENIERQIQKYSKDTFVKAMDSSIDDVRKPKALFTMELERVEDSDGLHINTISKTVFLSIPKNVKEFKCFVAEIAHEITHVFQQEADDRYSIKDLIETYYNNSDKNKAINTMNIMDDVFTGLEYGLSKVKDKTNIKDYIETTLALVLIKTHEDINFNMILDYCILRAKDEKEAYKNMYDFKPDPNILFKIGVYDKMTSSLSEIAKEYREIKSN